MFASNFSAWPEDMQIFPVTEVTVRVLDAPHPFDLAERERAAENWAREIAANPALYDGRMVLQHRISILDGRIESQAHVVPFSTFLWWRRNRDRNVAMHLFALPVMMSSDGAVIAIRMAQHTANPGRVYCAAGSLDAEDVVDGVCDLDGNMAREVMEETGIDLARAEAGPFHALHTQSAVTLFRTYRMPETADVLLEQIGQHIAGDPEPEADQVLAIRSADPDLHPYAVFMPPILAFVLGAA